MRWRARKSLRQWMTTRKQCLLHTAGQLHMSCSQLWWHTQDLCKPKPDCPWMSRYLQLFVSWEMRSRLSLKVETPSKSTFSSGMPHIKEYLGSTDLSWWLKVITNLVKKGRGIGSGKSCGRVEYNHNTVYKIIKQLITSLGKKVRAIILISEKV